LKIDEMNSVVETSANRLEHPKIYYNRSQFEKYREIGLEEGIFQRKPQKDDPEYPIDYVWRISPEVVEYL